MKPKEMRTTTYLSVNKASKKAAHQVAFSILNFDRIDDLRNA